jgi:uncharacterized membrane protein YkvA (DUF1232 family)
VSTDEIIEIELNPRERLLYDRVRALVISPKSSAPLGLRDLLLLLPDLVVLLSRLARDPRVPILAKAIALAGIAYAVSPVDFVPVLLFGPIGLVDDLLVVATALSRLMGSVHPDVIRGHWPGNGDALEAIQRVTNWGEEQVSSRLKGLRFWKLARR